MPLKPGKDKTTISKNISEMVKAGHPREQAVAASLHNADKFAAGGHLGQMKPMHMKNHPPHFGGLFATEGPGRVDNIPMSVPHNSYIVPADVVSGLGMGNSAAGGKALDRMFPHSASGGGFGGAKNSFMNKFSKGGNVHGHKMVPIITAGGEYHILPQDVQKLGNGHMQSGHKVLDHFVKTVREKTIKEMKNLPGPKK